MLQLYLEPEKIFDEATSAITTTKGVHLRLEHSLISISKWEQLWERPFLPSQTQKTEPKTVEQNLSYIECMIIGEVKPGYAETIARQHSSKVSDYITNPNTATTIHRRGGGRPNRQTVTSELIYYWMIRFGIPFEAEKWHLNRLLMLIEVCQIKELEATKKGKMSKSELYNRNASLNNARRAALNSKG